ncbi:MAG TPA: hypothetical protein DCY13_04920 [Verrucomicrobiales bacterium]|nr:hypothetical protein [Verrucomicrobiales bacterium]
MNNVVSHLRTVLGGSILGLLLQSPLSQAADPAEIPTLCVASVEQGNLTVAAHIRAGFASVVLETRPEAGGGAWSSHVSGSLDGREGMVVFLAPSPGPNAIFRIRAGLETTPPAAAHSGPSHFSVTYGLSSCFFSENERTGHVLNRLAYGPSEYDLQRISVIGLEAWIAEQLNPAGIDETSNSALNSRFADLFYSFQPAEATSLVRTGDTVKYFKGTSQPAAGWTDAVYNDSVWLSGPTGIGFGDSDDATVLTDMMGAYTTVFARKTFNVVDPSIFSRLELRMDYDDGFVAYLNGQEIARANASGTPLFNSVASGSHEAGSPETFDVTAFKANLVTGNNVLAVVGLNQAIDSSDFSLIPELVGLKTLTEVPQQTRIKGVRELQQLVHVRGAYGRRQLQAVMGEFWENHFTTDYEKVRDYFDDLRNSDAVDAMPYSQAEQEAAHAEFREHEFFYQNALGHFGDLLLYSATSPAQLIYLDNVLNRKGAPNENYAREILELFAFGVDNRYVQADIEQLARCFTGWTVRKMWPQNAPTYPASSRTPPTEQSVQFTDSPLIDLGSGWKYFKGTAEPTPVGGQPTTAWAATAYDDAGWSAGSTPIGYGEVGFGTTSWYGTQLTDMRQAGANPGYPSVYLRRTFTVANPASLENVVLSVKADDGFVAYLNGVEVARTTTMANTGTPPPFNRTANGNSAEPLVDQDFSLNAYLHLLNPAPQNNVLAIQLHNVSTTSSDGAIAPRIVLRSLLPGSIENGNPNGVWTFRFDPNEHDTNPKTLFSGTPYQMNIPGGRTGIAGLLDATDVIDAMVTHPSTAEFICVKLVNRFVSDEISLGTYHDRSAPAELLAVVDNAIAAWNTDVNGRRGHLGTVMGAIIDPIARVNVFWGDAGFKTKIKTPVEYINSTLRALNSQFQLSANIQTWNDRLGMHLFTRDEPDGWSEIGLDWMDSGTLLQRVEFSRLVANGSSPTGSYYWDLNAWVAANSITSAAGIVDYFNQKFYQGTLLPQHVNLLVTYGNTDANGNPSTLNPANSAHATRVRELVGLILSLPHWQYQ